MSSPQTSPSTLSNLESKETPIEEFAEKTESAVEKQWGLDQSIDKKIKEWDKHLWWIPSKIVKWIWGVPSWAKWIFWWGSIGWLVGNWIWDKFPLFDFMKSKIGDASKEAEELIDKWLNTATKIKEKSDKTVDEVSEKAAKAAEWLEEKWDFSAKKKELLNKAKEYNIKVPAWINDLDPQSVIKKLWNNPDNSWSLEKYLFTTWAWLWMWALLFTLVQRNPALVALNAWVYMLLLEGWDDNWIEKKLDELSGYKETKASLIQSITDDIWIDLDIEDIIPKDYWIKERVQMILEWMKKNPLETMTGITWAIIFRWLLLSILTKSITLSTNLVFGFFDLPFIWKLAVLLWWIEAYANRRQIIDKLLDILYWKTNNTEKELMRAKLYNFANTLDSRRNFTNENLSKHFNTFTNNPNKKYIIDWMLTDTTILETKKREIYDQFLITDTETNSQKDNTVYLNNFNKFEWKQAIIDFIVESIYPYKQWIIPEEREIFRKKLYKKAHIEYDYTKFSEVISWNLISEIIEDPVNWFKHNVEIAKKLYNKQEIGFGVSATWSILLFIKSISFPIQLYWISFEYLKSMSFLWDERNDWNNIYLIPAYLWWWLFIWWLARWVIQWELALIQSGHWVYGTSKNVVKSFIPLTKEWNFLIRSSFANIPLVPKITKILRSATIWKVQLNFEEIIWDLESWDPKNAKDAFSKIERVQWLLDKYIIKDLGANLPRNSTLWNIANDFKWLDIKLTNIRNGINDDDIDEVKKNINAANKVLNEHKTILSSLVKRIELLNQFKFAEAFWPLRETWAEFLETSPQNGSTPLQESTRWELEKLKQQLEQLERRFNTNQKTWAGNLDHLKEIKSQINLINSSIESKISALNEKFRSITERLNDWILKTSKANKLIQLQQNELSQIQNELKTFNEKLNSQAGGLEVDKAKIGQNIQALEEKVVNLKTTMEAKIKENKTLTWKNNLQINEVQTNQNQVIEESRPTEILNRELNKSSPSLNSKVVIEWEVITEKTNGIPKWESLTQNTSDWKTIKITRAKIETPKTSVYETVPIKNIALVAANDEVINEKSKTSPEYKKYNIDQLWKWKIPLSFEQYEEYKKINSTKERAKIWAEEYAKTNTRYSEYSKFIESKGKTPMSLDSFNKISNAQAWIMKILWPVAAYMICHHIATAENPEKAIIEELTIFGAFMINMKWATMIAPKHPLYWPLITLWLAVWATWLETYFWKGQLEKITEASSEFLYDKIWKAETQAAWNVLRDIADVASVGSLEVFNRSANDAFDEREYLSREYVWIEMPNWDWLPESVKWRWIHRRKAHDIQDWNEVLENEKVKTYNWIKILEWYLAKINDSRMLWNTFVNKNNSIIMPQGDLWKEIERISKKQIDSITINELTWLIKELIWIKQDFINVLWNKHIERKADNPWIKNEGYKYFLNKQLLKINLVDQKRTEATNISNIIEKDEQFYKEIWVLGLIISEYEKLNKENIELQKTV